jgi:hypothetical protein
VDEVRTLIGLATAKRKNEMLAMVDAMFKGRPLVAPPSDQDQFDTEYMRIISGLGEPVKKMIDAGAWVFRAHPITYCEERWRTTEELEKLIQRRSVRLRDEFPPHRRGTHAREWGVANDLYGETWSLARSGQFVYVKEFWENHQEYVSPWRVVGGSRETPKAAPGEWVDYKPSIYQIVELFAFLIRLVEEYETGEAIVFEVKATNLAGRVLLSTDRNIDLHFRFAEPCRASTFDVRKQMSSEELRAGWERICAATMKRFTDLFPSQHIGEDTMVGWIKKFLERKF